MAHLSILRWWRELLIGALVIVCAFLWQVNRTNRALLQTANSSLISIQETAAKTASSQDRIVERIVKVTVKPDGTQTTKTTDRTEEKKTEIQIRTVTQIKTETKTVAINSMTRYSLGLSVTRDRLWRPDERYWASAGIRIGNQPLFGEIVGTFDKTSKQWGAGLGLRIDF
jgi:hypothetical protein